MEWSYFYEKPIPGIIIILVGIISTGFTFYQYYDAEASSKKSEALNIKLQSKQDKIEELQNETIKQVLGGGYARVEGDFISQQNGFVFKLVNATNFPLFDICVTFAYMNSVKKLPHRIEGDEVFLNRQQYSTFEADVLLNASLSGNTHTELRYSLPTSHDPQYLQTKIMYKHGITMQYSIITYNPQLNSYDLSYRIFSYNPQLNKLDSLLEQGGPIIDNKIWEENFFYKKAFQLEGPKN